MNFLRRKIVYPTLVGKIAERGILKSEIATRLELTPRSFTNRLNGIVPFTWDEVVIIQHDYFPDVGLTELMRKAQ